MKTAIITDSGANLSQEFIKKHANLYVIPLMILVDGKSFRDQVEISAEEVYAQLDEKVITTSLPNMEDLTKVLEQAKKEGYSDALVINISSGLSGTFNAFRVALEDVKGLKITHYDTKTLGGGQGYIVEQALELVNKGVAPKDILEKLNEQRYKESLAIYTINTLKYLKRGGRIGKVEGTIGDILHIKPVITVNDEGVYITLSKAFGLQRSLLSMKELMVKKFEGKKIDLTVHYGDDKEKAEQLGNMLTKVLDVRTLTISPLTPVLGIHTGPMMFAYVARVVK
ncbi:MAG: DegV family protein [Firmicutes bacterium]|nr:DegV family protein [Bacillota bacterium]